VAGFVLLVTTIAGGVALAQQPTEGDAMPVDVTVKPTRALPKAPITVSGTTLVDGRHPAVAIWIAPPAGEGTALTGTLGTDGTYSVRFEKTATPGVYSVVVTAPDGKRKAKASFEIQGAAAFGDEAIAAMKGALDATDAGLANVTGLVGRVEDVPQRAELERKVADLRGRLADRQVAAQQIGDALKEIGKVAEQFPDAGPQLGRVFDKVRENTEETGRKRRELEEQTAQSRALSEKCEVINAAIEGLKLAAGLLNLVSNFEGVVLNFSKDIVAEKAGGLPSPPGLGDSAAYKLAVQEAAKLATHMVEKAPAKDFSPRAEMAGNIPTLAIDLVTFAVQLFFGVKCDKLEGPFTGTLHVDFVNDQGQVFWQYGIEVGGRLALRFAKQDKPEVSVPVHGEFFGSGTKFTVQDDVISVLFPKAKKAAMLFTKTFTPEGFPFVETEGRYIGAFGPRAFFIPVSGTLQGSTITIDILPAKTDFDGVAARTVYLAISPLSMVPVAGEYTLPYKGGRFVVNHALDAVDKPAVFEVKRSGKVALDRAFDRPNVRGDGNIASYTMKLKLCRDDGC
jgi:hypothetical protein